MNTTKQMAAIITKIAAAHGFNLDAADGSSLRLENGPYEPLVISALGPHIVSVAHYFEQNGDQVPDPDMTLYTGYGVENGWVPVEITMALGYRQQATILKEDHISEWYPRAQREQAQFANMWARNLKAQGWLTAAAA